jgi:hypothetical protein
MKKSSNSVMDEATIQLVKKISREIVRKEFPDEEEYFDFLFDLIIERLQEVEPGEEPEFLKELRTLHPLVEGGTAAVITLTFQVLSRYTFSDIENQSDEIDFSLTKEDLDRIFPYHDEKGVEREKLSDISEILLRNIRKAKEKAQED